ncbi:hypothetical protein [Aeromicrobium sp.]|uniref:hypothetical protein n=1 Tax=Aeromicrobium sp. TaxID=1871063 RepID=UPI0030C28E84
MISTAPVVVAARLVRIAVAVVTTGLLVGYIAISSFASQYGEATPMILDTKSSDTALAAAISEQESAGLTCREKPALTDVVLFQRGGAAEVTILTFDEAIQASAAREGWVRRYCVTP